ncbi:MAG: hypothetical protein IPK55_10880 [Streptococcus sp.]|nr:hypothetical protein [Streptococcus sp.]
MKEEDMAIEVCEEMMEALNLRKFISSKFIYSIFVSNIHPEKNGKGVFALRVKATEDRARPKVKARALKMRLEDFNLERKEKRNVLGDQEMSDQTQKSFKKDKFSFKDSKNKQTQDDEVEIK